MKYNTDQLQAEGKTYRTVMDFCEHFGFKYTSVKYHIRKGKTGDEIVAALRQNSIKKRYSHRVGKGTPVTVNDVQYSSVVEACEAYGLQPHQVYSLTKAEKISHEAAIIKLIEKRPGHTTPCTISGITYPSREAAARAYSIPMQTIRARMARHGYSFEEAILYGSKERCRMVPEKTKWQDLNLKPIEPPEKDNSLLYLIYSVLTSNNYPSKCFFDTEKHIWAVRFKESMELDSELIETYLLFDNDDPSRDLELIMPVVAKTKPLSSKERHTLLEQFNSLNNTYTGAKISMVENKISISWSIALGRAKITSTAFMRMLCRFIGTASVLWKETFWATE